jgi:hypothetical protein
MRHSRWCPRLLALALMAAGVPAPASAAWYWPFGGEGSTTSTGDPEASPPATTTATTTAAARPHGRRVRDLAYGEALYDYYRQHYLGALTTLSAARQGGGLQQDGIQASMLEATLAVSLDMLQDAETLFASTLEGNASRDEINHTWLSIAAIHYRQGRHAEAHRILSTRISQVQADLSAQVRLLEALSLIGADRKDDAAVVLGQLKDDSALDGWSRFNLAVAQSTTGLNDAAVDTFRSIILDPNPDPDFQPLRDRASYACAMHYFREKHWEKARHYLNLVRLDSHVAEPALLAAGWVAFNDEDKIGALTPWLTLVERNSGSPAAEEVLLNIPYVYEEQGALVDALDGYRRADAALQAGKARIEEAKSIVQAAEWVDRISPPPDANDDPLDDLPAFRFQPDDASPWLYRYLASNEFLATYRNYREVQRLNLLLKRWQEALPIYRETLDDQLDALEQATRFSDRKAALASRFRDNVKGRRDTLVNAGDQLVGSRDDAALADNLQQRTLERIRRLEAQMAALPDARYAAEKARLARIRGMLSWELAEQAPRERWSIVRDQARLDMAIDDFERTFSAMQENLQRRDTRAAQSTDAGQRVGSMIDRLSALREECQTALVNQRLFLRRQALDALTRQQIRLDQLRGYSLLSIARLQDKSIAGSIPASTSVEKTMSETIKPVAMPASEAPAPKRPTGPKTLMDALDGWF